MKKRVAVVFGGQSSEHDVSCVSAANVIDGLREDKYDIYRIGIPISCKSPAAESSFRIDFFNPIPIPVSTDNTATFTECL